MKISHELSRHLPADHVRNLHVIHDRYAAMLAEAKAAAADPRLAAWRPDATLLVSGLSHTLEGYEVRLQGFAASLPALEAADRAEREASAAFETAKGLYARGSLKRAEAVGLWESLVVTESAHRVRARELNDAAEVSRSYLPATNQVEEGPAKVRDLVKAVGSNVLIRVHQPAKYDPISDVVWSRWLEMPDEDLRWLALHAYRTIVSEDLYVVDTRFAPQGSKLPIGEFAKELARLKADREARVRSKVSEAQATIERARAAAAALGAA